MGYEIPKTENRKSDSQFHIFDIVNKLQEIDQQYPYAKINPAIVKGDMVNGLYIDDGGKKIPLDQYAKERNDLYSPSDDELVDKKWWNK